MKLKQVARTALVSLALGALSQACVPENNPNNTGTGGRGGSSGTGGAGGTGGGVATGGSGGSGGSRAPDGRRPDGRAPDGRRPDGRAPDGRRPDAGTRDTGNAAAAPRMAVSEFVSTDGYSITGRVTFLEVADGIQMTYAIENCEPGVHPTHIHQGDDCAANARGVHWNPPRGEMINTNNLVTCGPDRRGTLVYTRSNAAANLRWTIGPPANTDIVGHPVIVHGPGANNTGVFQGCGVIRMAAPSTPAPGPAY